MWPFKISPVSIRVLLNLSSGSFILLYGPKTAHLDVTKWFRHPVLWQWDSCDVLPILEALWRMTGELIYLVRLRKSIFDGCQVVVMRCDLCQIKDHVCTRFCWGYSCYYYNNCSLPKFKILQPPKIQNLDFKIFGGDRILFNVCSEFLC